MDWQKRFCILTLTRCTSVTQPQQSNLHTLNWGGGGGGLTKKKNFKEVGGASPGGRETKSWAFINKA